MLYPEINTYSKTPDNSLTHDAKNILLSQIIGLFFLFFVVFCVIWASPENNLTNEAKTNNRRRTEKKEIEQIDFKEEDTDKMIKNGYVLTLETGKWEKPKP